MQGIAYVLAIGWLGVGIRRGAGRRSGGEKKERQGDRCAGELRGYGGKTRGFITQLIPQIFCRIYRESFV